VTGAASIDSNGLVTGIANGTVYGVAIALQDNTVSDSILITLTNQTASAPTVVTLPASNVTSNAATLNGTVNANTLSTDVIFAYGTNVFYGHIVPANPPTVTGNTVTPVSADITGLTPNTLYHYRVSATNAAGTSTGADITFSTGNVGVSGNDPSKIDIYPVPNDGHFNITLNSENEVSYKLEIYNNLGERIYGDHTIIVKGTTVTSVDLGPVPSGLYTIILRIQKTRRFVNLW